jgi:hypothetical protein
MSVKRGLTCQLNGPACHTMSPALAAVSKEAISSAVGQVSGPVRLFIRVRAAQVLRAAQPSVPAMHCCGCRCQVPALPFHVT